MRIVFMGTGEIALPSLHWLLEEAPDVEVTGVFTQPDKKVGRKRVLTPPQVKVVAGEHGVPVVQPDRLRGNAPALEQLASFEPDLVVVMAYGQILPRAVIDAPRIACVNLHASLLPRHRGASPIQAAIREGDDETGITLMHIAPQLDAGDMILKKAIGILPRDTGGTLHDRLAGLGPGILAEGLPLFASGKAPREVQDEQFVTFAPKLERSDGWIDWHAPAEEIERLVRAYDPWPGTLTRAVSGGKPTSLKVFPHVSTGHSSGEEPGTILSIGNELAIACGEGTALFAGGDLQWEGKKRLPAVAFLRGSGLEVGMRLAGP